MTEKQPRKRQKKNELFGLKSSNTSSDNGSQKFMDFDGKQCNKLALFAWKSPIFMSSSKRIAFCERPGASVANGAQNGPSAMSKCTVGVDYEAAFLSPFLLDIHPCAYAVQSDLFCALPFPFITKTRLQEHKNNGSNTKEKTRRSWNLLPDPDFLAQCVPGFQQNFAK
uniref:Uncharacterized protein n=1 Tax=Globodera rostochiensis TaxID=31243 RepID=A0A914I9S9_GLORO